MPFTDNKGEKWENLLDWAAIQRVNATTEVRLLKDPIPTLFDKLADPVVLISVLYAINEPAIQARRMSAEEFGPRCLVDQNPIFLDLMEQSKSFFLELGQSRKLATLTEMLAQSQTLFDLIDDDQIATAELSLMREKFNELEAKLIERRQWASTGSDQASTSTSSSGDSPESPAEIPTEKA